MKFIVDRRTWYRGQGSSCSQLLNKDGQRCCIGFVGQQSEVSDDSMRGAASIGVCKTKTDQLKFPTWMRDEGGSSSLAVSAAYNINDSSILTDEEREAQLKEHFAKYGDEIEFIN